MRTKLYSLYAEVLNTNILLATSALDQISETHVQNALKNIREKKKITTITIAHRLTTIIDSNVIGVINNGSIAELGDHMTLLKKEDGIYKSLCETQGITPSNLGASKGVRLTASLTINTTETKNGLKVSCQSEKDSSELEAGQKGVLEDDLSLVDGVDVDEVVEPVPMARMSKIWKFLGFKDTFYAVIGIMGSGAVGALSPCESILTAQIVT